MTNKYYASVCYSKYGVFTHKGLQVGDWWPTFALAQQAATLLNEQFLAATNATEE